MTINVLPDDDLLEMFDFYVIEFFREKQRMEWKTLAHVCRRWRSLVFQSPRRLNLRLLYTPKTRMRDILDVWPPLPLIIHDFYGFPLHWEHRNDTSSVDNIIAALTHNDLVCQIKLDNFPSSKLGKVTDSPAMQKPFPELTDLRLNLPVCAYEYDRPGPILPDSFLGGTAPRLRSLQLHGVAFPGLPKLLLSATHLVKLDFYHFYFSGYIPPEAMVTGLSALNSLELLHLHVLSRRPRPALESRHPPPLTRSILPNLTKIEFIGASEYLEEILARIDAPRLNKMFITFFFNEIVFDTPQLFQFISRSPTLRAPEKGWIAFYPDIIIVGFSSQTSHYRDDVLFVEIPYTALGWQLSYLTQICTSSLPPVSTLEDLHILANRGSQPRWQDDVENTLWLELLHPFAAVKNLYLREEFVPRIAPALQELVGGRTTEVLPTLENIFLEVFQPPEPLYEGIEKFVAARRLTNHPVAVSRWKDRGMGIYDW
jgi:hypothetical protein